MSDTKLTEKEVLEIKKLKGVLSASEVGRRYGVYGTTGRDVWKGKTWKHL